MNLSALISMLIADVSGDYLHDFTRLCSRKDSLQEILGRSAGNDDSGLVTFLFTALPCGL